MRDTLLTRRSTRDERRDAGAAARRAVPLEAHADVGDETGRDPIGTLRTQDRERVQDLVPIRWGRMSATPFTFYRGAAAVMAADLGRLPDSGLRVQLCGDAHLSNFGAFAAPDRRLVFDMNDFDETLPGPFEWDVKRLAASVIVAGRANGLGRKQCQAAAAASVRAYRSGTALAAGLDPIDIWYFRVELDAISERIAQGTGSIQADLDAATPGKGKKSRQAKDLKAARSGAVKQVEALRAAAAKKDRLRAAAKLTELVDGRRRIKDRPPLVVRLPAEDLEQEVDRVARFFAEYVGTLPANRQALLQRYALSDIARKVVGVGSVGTRCLIALFEDGDGDPLMLQVKEAGPSVLEPFAGAYTGGSSGKRVVEGQQLVQSAQDEFLGWSRDLTNDFYVRQLWDGKASANVDAMDAATLTSYATLCGAVVARAHARSGDAAAISGYIGDDDTFDRAIVRFATAYADRTEADHARAVEAIDAGEIPVVREV